MPAFLLAMMTGRVSRWFVLGGALALLIAGVWWKIDHDARQSALATIERANRVAADRADAAQRDVLTCQGTWDREAGRCEP